MNPQQIQRFKALSNLLKLAFYSAILHTRDMELIKKVHTPLAFLVLEAHRQLREFDENAEKITQDFVDAYVQRLGKEIRSIDEFLAIAESV